MNDRLGDLGEDLPSWVVQDNGNAPDVDIEKGNQVSEDGTNNNPFGGSDDGDFDFVAVEESSKTEGTEEAAQKALMDQFFKDVESIKGDIEAVKEATRRIGEINEESLMSTSDNRENELSQQMRPLVDDTNKRAKRTKNLLALLKEDNTKYKNEDKIKASDMRIRENLCNTLTRKFIDEMKLYQNSQQKYKTDIKKKAARQIQIVKPDASPEEVDMIMKSDGGREELYRQSILVGDVADPIKQAYSNVAGKYQDVLCLEQSVAELHQMFLDFALLTEQQGELLDQIEFNVKSAGDYVEDANVDVYEAIEYQKKIRKKQCWIILIVIIVAIVILFAAGILP